MLVRTRSDAQLRAEVLALRHRLRVVERKIGKPAWRPGNGILLAGLSRLLLRSGLPSLLPRRETLLRWHRDLVRRRWAAFPRRPPRPHPARDPERRECILRLARKNPRWGYRRIQGEALKLGFRISHMGVAKMLRSHRIPPAPRRSQTTWRRFVRQHGAQMLATDFFTVETAWLQRLHVLFFIEIASRTVHLGGITASPTGQWVAQQARNLAWKFETPIAAPRANAHIERQIGSGRRECLGWVLIVGDRHLERVMGEWIEQYNEARPHRSLDLRTPIARSDPVLATTAMHCRARLGGLLRQYSCAPALAVA